MISRIWYGYTTSENADRNEKLHFHTLIKNHSITRFRFPIFHDEIYVLLPINDSARHKVAIL